MAVHHIEVANLFSRSSPSRTGWLIAPREHGAWGLLLVPTPYGRMVGVLQGGYVLPFVTSSCCCGAFSGYELQRKTGLARACCEFRLPRIGAQ